MLGYTTIDEVLEVKEEITSNYFSLETLIKHPTDIILQIPLYQRLYVWGIEEIKLFIEDITEACLEDQNSYYIGNMMFANTENDDIIVIDLIDGQQRFTTLWLISIILGEYNENLKKFAFLNDKPRLSFTSRDKVNSYFAHLSNSSFNILENKNVHFDIDDESIEPIVKGIRNIYNAIKDVIVKYNWDKKSLSLFGDYIFEKLIMVQTTVPAKNNLNQIFESLNSGGKQLENHQILKSRLISVLKKAKTSKVDVDLLVYKWDASSSMNQYLERSIYSITNAKWENVLHDQIWSSGFESNRSEDYFQLNNYITNSTEAISLLSILEEEPDVQYESNKNGAEDCRSIISFSQLLLHSLRVYNLVHKTDNVVPVDSKHLLNFFDTDNGHFSNATNVISFINLVFDLRFLFDKYVIKWSSEDGDNQDSLLINKVYYNRNNKSHSVKRDFVESNRQLCLAQSTMYIVQESKTQYWITPFLLYLYKKYITDRNIDSYDDSVNSAVTFIEKLDNSFYNQKNADDTMSKLSFKDYSLIFEKESVGNLEYVLKQLIQLKGTFFFRYWFYKTEYLIWKYRDNFKEIIPDSEFELWNKYKTTFKTSIEHIFPQSKDGFENVTDRGLFPSLQNPILKDYFGNLVLLTVNENSEYGASDVDDKKTKFKNKLNNSSIDSLKSSLIFKLVDQENDEFNWEKGIWSFNKAKYHLEQQISPLYQKHLRS
jgi:uncharacterized protein with ParB-like and HNH nuclease domain